ncbi:hypothetical protein K1719_030595 [Acacia pycnantha]|nr:hypothetical protein K1719_030595 [Acacia pycnantha]
MGSKWRKLKLALGLNLCVHVPRDIDDSSPSQNSTARFIGSYSPSDVSPSGDSSSHCSTTSTPSSFALQLTKSGSKSPKAINKQEYDSANAKFPLELAQKKPPQVTTPLLVTPAMNPMDTPHIAKFAQVRPILQLEPEFFFETPNEVALKVFLSGFHFIPTNLQKTR